MKTSALFSSCRPVFVSLAAALILSSQAFAQINVTTLADEDDLPAGAQISLREALRDIADGGLITFDASLAGGALVLTKDELVVLGKTVTVDAPGGLVIDGRWLSRIFQVGFGAGLNLTGVTLQHGRPPVGDGGAILSSSTLTLTDCVLRDNRAASGAAGAPGVARVGGGGSGGPGGPGSDGGAIHNTGSLSAIRCHFIDNFAGDGGHGGNGGNDLSASLSRGGAGGVGGPAGSGGAILNVGPLQLTECIFAGNKSGAGGGGGLPGEPLYRSCGSNGGDSGSGGALRQYGILTVDRCTFHRNSSPSGGLGYHNIQGLCSMYGYRGAAGMGAAISCAGGSAALTNSTFVANQPGFGGSAYFGSAPGGAIHAADQVPLRLVHCTVTENSAVSPFTPPGAFNWFYTPQAPQTAGIAGSPQCENCAVSGNTVTVENSTQEINFSPGVQPVLIPPDSPGTTAGVNLQLSLLSITSGPLPVLVPGAASPALNAGAVLSDPPDTDQRGLPREGGAPDLGAVEVQDTEPALRTPQSITFSPPEVAASASVSLSASATSSQLVSFELLAGPATLDGSTLTFTASPGFAVVRASQSGDAATAPALPLVRIIEAPRTQTIPFTPAGSYVVYPGSESTVTLPATTSAGLPVTWTLVGAPAPEFSLSGNIVTATAVGSVQVRGRNPGNAQHSTLDSTWSLTFVAGSVQWAFPAGNQSGFPLFTFVEGSPHGMFMTAYIGSPHTSPLTVSDLPGGLVATPSILPAGQTLVSCLIILPANPQLFDQTLIIGEPGISNHKFCLANRASIRLDVVTPPTVLSGARAQVDVSCPDFLMIASGCPPVNLSVRSVAVSAVDFDNLAISVPVTLKSVTNDAGTNLKKHLQVTFPPMDRRVKLIITTDDGITAQSGPIQVISDTNSDGDGINDIVETALQRTPNQVHPPPLTIEQDAAGPRAVLASRPLDLQGWTVVIELSTDLNTWTPAAAGSITLTPNPDGTTERVSVLLPARPKQHFVRLRVTGP